MKLLRAFFPRDPVPHIDEHAAALLHSSTQAAKAILDRRAEMDRKGHENEPLVVLAGEAHNNSAHHIHHLLLIKKLQEQETQIAVAFEQPHNKIEETFTGLANQLINETAAIPGSRFRGGATEKTGLLKALKQAPEKSQESDTNGQLARVVSLATFYNESCYSDAILNQALIQRSILSVNTDTARHNVNDTGYITHDDPSSAQSIEKCLGPNIPNNAIESCSANGVYIRNHHMADKALEYAAKNKTRIIVQLCGEDHILGDNKRYSAEQSLAGILKEWNKAVFCVSSEDIKSNTKHETLQKNELYKADLPPIFNEHHFSLMNSSSLCRLFVHTRLADHFFIKTQKQEEAYVNGLLQKTDMEDYASSVEQLSDVTQTRKRIFQAFEAHLPPSVKISPGG